MSEIKHTPGPLKAIKGTEDESERWLVVADGPKAWHIARIENGQPGDCCETEGATARLFAAAPELLALARRLLFTLHGARPENIMTELARLNSEVNNALAKVKGI